MPEEIANDISITAEAFVSNWVNEDCDLDDMTAALAVMLAQERSRWCGCNVAGVPLEPVGYFLHGSGTAVTSLMSLGADIDAFRSAGEAVEPIYTAAQIEQLRQHDRTLLALLQESVDAAAQAASETRPSWKHRCYSIMSALGLDYGDPDWLMPDERKKLVAALSRVADLEAALHAKDIGQDEVERLIDAERSLVGHVVYYYPHDEAIWQVWKGIPGQVRLSSHRTRWEAIATAEIADRAVRHGAI